MEKKKSKKELLEILEQKEMTERKVFLDVYHDFNTWLRSLGFRAGKYTECATPADYHYSWYDKYIDSLHGVELYFHDTLKISIRFLRDRNTHKFMFVAGSIGEHGEVRSIEQVKELLLNKVREIRDEKLAALKELESI